MKKATSVVDEMVRKRLAFAGMLMHHVGVIPDGTIEKFSRNEFRGEIPDRLLFAFSDEPEPKTVAAVAPPTSRNNAVIMKWLTKWPIFCKKFGLKVEIDFRALKSDPRILNRREGFDWFVYKPIGFTAREAIEILKKLKSDFTVWEEIPVEEYVSKEDRPPTPHIVLCRADREPDNDWRMSADSMCTTKVSFLDHTERYLLEAFHYWLYKKSLDINGWTRCPRSRASDDEVAYADRSGSEFGAFWDRGGDDAPGGGGREVVIL